MNMELINSGLIASGFGLGGVFLVLILFYLIIKLMLFVFKKFPEK
jgi:Na+-transporting methylmalonyl-CoA/oxaloacetate decarboxylase gamma subunit